MDQSHNPAFDAQLMAETPVTKVMRAVLAEHFDIHDQQLSHDQPLEALGLDSLGFVEYLFELESELKIILPDVPRDIRTVGALVAFIDTETRNQGAMPA